MRDTRLSQAIDQNLGAADAGPEEGLPRMVGGLRKSFTLSPGPKETKNTDDPAPGAGAGAGAGTGAGAGAGAGAGIGAGGGWKVLKERLPKLLVLDFASHLRLPYPLPAELPPPNAEGVEGSRGTLLPAEF